MRSSDPERDAYNKRLAPRRVVAFGVMALVAIAGAIFAPHGRVLFVIFAVVWVAFAARSQRQMRQ